MCQQVPGGLWAHLMWPRGARGRVAEGTYCVTYSVGDAMLWKMRNSRLKEEKAAVI